MPVKPNRQKNTQFAEKNWSPGKKFREFADLWQKLGLARASYPTLRTLWPVAGAAPSPESAEPGAESQQVPPSGGRKNIPPSRRLAKIGLPAGTWKTGKGEGKRLLPTAHLKIDVTGSDAITNILRFGLGPRTPFQSVAEFWLASRRPLQAHLHPSLATKSCNFHPGSFRFPSPQQRCPHRSPRTMPGAM